VSEPPFTPAEDARPSRWTGFGPALARFALACGAVVVGLGLVALVVALATDRSVSGTIALAYYIVGCLLFLIGTFPTGGFSVVRGTMTRRKPMGIRAEPIFLYSIVLIGLGFIVDFSFS
jgi:hypothetical protein